MVNTSVCGPCILFSLSLSSCQLEGLPREDLIKYIKKQAQMVQKLKTKNEGMYICMYISISLLAATRSQCYKEKLLTYMATA